MEFVTGTIEDLPLPIPIEEIIAKNKKSKFKILSYSVERYNEFDVISEDVTKDEYFQLKDDILEAVEAFKEIGESMKRLPNLKEVILAPAPAPAKDGSYHRVVILKLSSDKTAAKFSFIDCGGKGTSPVKDLIPVTAEVLSHPPMLYHIILDNVSKTEIIYGEHFSNLMEKMKKQFFQIELGEPFPETKGRFLVNKPATLRCTYKETGRNLCLSEEINKILEWEWERLLKSSEVPLTDDKICEMGFASFSKDKRVHWKDLDDRFFSLEVGEKFTAMVTLVRPSKELDILEEGNGKPVFAQVLVTYLDTPAYRNQFELLHSHLERFAEAVKPSNFFPADGEVIMFKINTNKENRDGYQKIIKQTDCWIRASRLDSDRICCIDLGQNVPFTKLPTEDYEIRRLYGEFVKVPCLTSVINLKRKGQSIELEKAEKVFQPKMRFQFEITGCNDDGIYDAEIDYVKKKE